MNRKTKWSHRLLALALAAVMCCSVFPVGAFAETPLPQESTVATEEQQTDETETDNGQTDASNPDPGATTEESAAPTTDEPAEENEPYTFDGEILYADMPDAPTGSYIGSYGLPVATGEIKIGLSAWDADLEQDSYLSAEALDSDNLTLTTPLLEDTDYAIVPIDHSGYGRQHCGKLGIHRHTPPGDRAALGRCLYPDRNPPRRWLRAGG